MSVLVRNEFYEIYYNCFYKLFSEFRYFKDYLGKLKEFDLNIETTGDIYDKETWKSVFLDGKSLFYTLKNKSQKQNKFSEKLEKIEEEFINNYLADSFFTFGVKKVEEKELFNSFRTLVFQIGYVQSFYEYCKIIHNCEFETASSQELQDYCNDFLEKVNLITNQEWANYFLFVNELQGEKHPKFFPVITHLILRKIQPVNSIFDLNPENKYFSPECFYFHEKSIESIDKIIIEDFGTSEIQSMNINELWVKQKQGVTYGNIFADIISAKKTETERIFNEFLNIPTIYLDQLNTKLLEDIKKSLKVN